MDGDSAVERVWLKASGQPDAECITHVFSISVLAGAFWCGNGESLTCRSFGRGCRLDAAVRTCGLCDRGLLPLPVLHYHRFTLWTALYDTGSIGGSLDGVGDAGSADDTDEHRGYVGDTLRYQHLCIGTWRTSQGNAEIASQRCAVCYRSCCLSRHWVGAE